MSLLFAGFEGRFATIDDTRGKATSQCAVRGVRVRARACLPVASALRQTQRGQRPLPEMWEMSAALETGGE